MQWGKHSLDNIIALQSKKGSGICSHSLHALRETKVPKRCPWGTIATNGTLFSKGHSFFLNNHVYGKTVPLVYWGTEIVPLRVLYYGQSSNAPRGTISVPFFSECVFPSEQKPEQRFWRKPRNSLTPLRKKNYSKISWNHPHYTNFTNRYRAYVLRKLLWGLTS